MMSHVRKEHNVGWICHFIALPFVKEGKGKPLSGSSVKCNQVVLFFREKEINETAESHCINSDRKVT